MSFARTMAKKLTSAPRLKAALKNAYAYAGNLMSDRKTNLPGLCQISSDSTDHNFGYYDKSPWSKDGKYMIYLQPKDAARKYVSDELTPIILYEFATKSERILAKTHVWNSQQGAMLQWLGPDFSSRVLYNDFRDGKYCSVILNIADSSEQIIDMPVYSVAPDGITAASLDFSRLNTFGKGYGYCNLMDETRNQMMPDLPCIWTLNLKNNTVQALPFTYRELSQVGHQDSMDHGYHKINHIMINPAGTRMMFIHRWIVNGVKHHRLMTCNMDGSELYVLLDHGMVSHNNWKDNETIVSFCYSREYGDAYHILHDRTQNREAICTDVFKVDGHPSFSPDGAYMITDCYPDFKRKQTLYLVRVSDWQVRKLGDIYANIRYRNDTRCDLHPRWNYNSTEVCIDGACGKFRQVFTVPVDRF